jgi:hypothetical protein
LYSNRHFKLASFRSFPVWQSLSIDYRRHPPVSHCSSFRNGAGGCKIQ